MLKKAKLEDPEVLRELASDLKAVSLKIGVVPIDSQFFTPPAITRRGSDAVNLSLRHGGLLTNWNHGLPTPQRQPQSTVNTPIYTPQHSSISQEGAPRILWEQLVSVEQNHSHDLMQTGAALLPTDYVGFPNQATDPGPEATDSGMDVDDRQELIGMITTGPHFEAMVARCASTSSPYAAVEGPDNYVMFSSTPTCWNGPFSTQFLDQSDSQVQGAMQGEDIFSPSSTGINSAVSGTRSSDCGWSQLAMKLLATSLTACICEGAGLPDADDYIDKTKPIFRQMMQTELWDVLTTLSRVITILGAYGQVRVQQEVLIRAQYAAIEALGPNDPCRKTIEFLLRIPKLVQEDLEGELKILHSINMELEQAYGFESPATLTAQYNQGWLLARFAGDDRTIRDTAKDLLSSLAPRLQEVFGPSHTQTTCCLMSLSRVLLHAGEHDRARATINQAIDMMRSSQDASDYGPISAEIGYNPYILEARSRQAWYVAAAGLVQEAEALYRDVATRQWMVLGPENLRTKSTIRNLQNLLRQQRLFDAADNIEIGIERNIRNSAKYQQQGRLHSRRSLSRPNDGMYENEDDFDLNDEDGIGYLRTESSTSMLE